MNVHDELWSRSQVAINDDLMCADDSTFIMTDWPKFHHFSALSTYFETILFEIVSDCLNFQKLSHAGCQKFLWETQNQVSC